MLTDTIRRLYAKTDLCQPTPRGTTWQAGAWAKSARTNAPGLRRRRVGALGCRRVQRRRRGLEKADSKDCGRQPFPAGGRFYAGPRRWRTLRVWPPPCPAVTWPARRTGATELRFWNGFTGPDGRTILKLVKRFNRDNPDVRVTVQRMEWNDLLQQAVRRRPGRPLARGVRRATRGRWAGCSTRSCCGRWATCTPTPAGRFPAEGLRPQRAGRLVTFDGQAVRGAAGHPPAGDVLQQSAVPPGGPGRRRGPGARADRPRDVRRRRRGRFLHLPPARGARTPTASPSPGCGWIAWR